MSPRRYDPFIDALTFLVMIALSVVAILCVVMVAVYGADAAHAAELPWINSGGWSSTLVTVNPTAEAIQWPDYYEGFGSGRTIPECSFLRDSAYFGEGGSVASVNPPEGLIVYTEVENPDGIRIRVSDIGAKADRFAFYDIVADQGWFAFLFVTSPQGAALKIHGNEEMTQSVPAGQTVVVAIPSGTSRLVVERDPYWDAFTGEGPFFAYVIESH